MAQNVDNMQVRGELRERALAGFAKQMRGWDVAMPAVEPLVLDFGLGQFEKTGLIEYWIANEEQAGYCGKYLFVFDGQTCPLHSHAKKHETFYVVKGSVTLTVNGKPHTMTPGAVLAMPPGDVHSFRGNGNALLLEISTPCLVADNRFEDPRIMHWLRGAVAGA